MNNQMNTVTKYSKLGTIIFFLLFVPVLCFYMGKMYQEVTTTQVASAGSMNKIGIWSRVSISENELEKMFNVAHAFIQKNTTEYVYYNLVLEKMQNDWVYINIIPQTPDQKKTQIYMIREGTVWTPKAFGEPTSEVCTMYAELGC